MLHSLLQPLRDLLTRLFGKRPKPAAKAKPAVRPAPAKPVKKKPKPKDGPPPETFAFSIKATAKPDPSKPQAKPQPKPQAKPPAEDGEPGEDMDLEVKSGTEKKDKRTAFRVSIRGMDVASAELNARCPAVDISATGIGFQYQGPRVKGGTLLNLDLRLAGKILAPQIPVKVMRHEGGVLGCAFLELNRVQEDAVGKIVVGAQRGTLFPSAGGAKPGAPQQAKPGAAPAKPAAPQGKPAAPQAKPQAPAQAKPAAPQQARPAAAAAKPAAPQAKPAAAQARPVSPPGATRK